MNARKIATTAGIAAALGLGIGACGSRTFFPMRASFDYRGHHITDGSRS